jgi:hypothetical protein
MLFKRKLKLLLDQKSVSVLKVEPQMGEARNLYRKEDYMAVTVVNVGMFERDSSGARTTNVTKSVGDQGTVDVTVRGRRWTFGPGQSITFSDHGEAAECVAADSRLRIADTREGNRTTGRS